MATATKKYILRFRAVNKRTLEDLKSGRKKVETRAATVKYRGIKKGDKIILACGKTRFETTVKHSSIFKSISAMLRKYKVQDIMPELSLRDELERIYFSYPNYREKIKKFGLIALELRK